MPTTLTKRAVEKTTFPIRVSFFDEDGEAVSPAAGLVWSMTNEHGTVINSRSNVSISSSSVVTIVLSGADLDLDDGNARIVTVEGTFDSDLGAGLPIKDQVTFFIENLTIVS